MANDQTIALAIKATAEEVQSTFQNAKDWVSSFVEHSNSELNEAGRGFKESFAGIKETLEGFSSGRGESIVAGIGTALTRAIGPAGELAAAILAAGAAGVEFASHTAEAAETLVNLHFETGLSTESLKVWGGAAQAVGVSESAISSAIARMQMRLAQLATAGAGSAKQLEGSLHILGISMSELAGDPTNALLAVGEKLKAATEGAGNYSLIMGAAAQVMGRNFRELAPVLVQGAKGFERMRQEMALYGTTVYQDVRADETAEDIHGLSRAWEELRNQIGALLMPAVDALVKGLTDLLHALDLLFKGINVGITTVKGLTEELVDWAAKLSPVKTAVNALEEAWKSLKEAASWAVSFTAPAFAPVVDTANAIANVVKGGYARGTELDKEEEAKTKQLAGGGAAPGGPPQTAAQIVAEIAAATKAQESVLAITEATNKQRLAYGQETAVQEIAQETDLANQKYAIQLGGLEKERAVAGLKPEEAAKINAQIVELQNAHTAEMIGLATKLTEAQNKESERQVQEQIKGLNETLAYQKAVIDLKEKTFEITPEQAAQTKAAQTAQELDLEKNVLEQEQNLRNLDLAERQRIADQIRDIDAKLALQLIDDAKLEAEAMQKAAQDAAKAWDSGAATINKSLDSVLNLFIERTRHMGQEWKKLVEEMVKSLASSGLSALLTGGSKGSIFESIFGTTGGGKNVPGGGESGLLGLGGGLSGLVAQIIPGGPGGLAKSLFSGLGTVISDAFRSAAPGLTTAMSTAFIGAQSAIKTAFQSAWSFITGTAGGAASSAAGSVASGAVSALGSATSTATQTTLLTTMNATLLTIAAGIAALNAEETALVAIESAKIVQPFGFAGGGIVPSAAGGMIVGGGGGGVPAILHPKEMVLPRNLSEGVQNMISGGGAGGGGKDMPDIHVNYSAPSMDAKNVASTLRQHGGVIADIVKTQMVRYGQVYRGRVG